jgi:thiosulfate reductase cytochrome b subunit
MAESYLYYRHKLAVRVMHWVNVLSVFILLMSGLRIFNAHPALYWGKSSYTGNPPLWELAGGFPSWITLPGSQWLSMARNWHLFFAWVLVINGACYIAYSFASRHVARDLAPSPGDWRSIGQSIKDHLRFRHAKGEDAKRYNVLQKLAYLVIVFGVLPLLVLMGLGMSPWLDSLVPGWVDIVGGRQSARTLHFTAACLLMAFVAVHVFEVLVTGFWNNLRSMITGRYRVHLEGGNEAGE